MILELLTLSQINNPKPTPPPPIQTEIVEILKPKQEDKTHKVKQGDTLTKVAKKHKTTVERLFYKNKQIKNPDILEVGETLTIPTKTEKLKKRKIPHQSVQTGSEAPKIAHSGSYAPAGWYDYGSCTYGAWLLAPWVGRWSDANTWDDMARAEGYIVNNTPAVGAVFVDNGGYYGHVGVVTKLGKNTVTIKEMNYRRAGQWTVRTVPASSFVYIHY